ncbi:MAG: hypothetical protein ACI9XR_002749, partial [Flavobacterium sp.]
NSALDYGSRGYWFESSQGHIKNPKYFIKSNLGFFYFKIATNKHLIVLKSLIFY